MKSRFPSSVAPSPKRGVAWIAPAALILAMTSSLFAAVPRAAAQDSPPSSFPSEAAAIEYFVGLQAAGRRSAPVRQFPSEAAAIEYFVALQAAGRQSASVRQFPSETAAIEYFVGLQAAGRQSAPVRQFRSEAAAIEYFVGLQAAIRSGRAAAPESVAEQPFPVVEGQAPARSAVLVGRGTRYTDVSVFYVERLRAARDSARLAPEGIAEQPFPEVEAPIVQSADAGALPGMRYTDVSVFYVERVRAAIARGQAGLSR